MTKLVLATGNTKKLSEIDRLLRSAHSENLTLLTVNDLEGFQEPQETGTTFAENALIKARAIANTYHLPALADDSGLCVDILSGMPGIFSARWSGHLPGMGAAERDARNRKLLLEQLTDVLADHRTAHFMCACALVLPDGKEFITEGSWDGMITTTERGENGFGYDSIFAPHEFPQRTAAMLTAEEKDQLSHRHKALLAMLPLLLEFC